MGCLLFNDYCYYDNISKNLSYLNINVNTAQVQAR